MKTLTILCLSTAAAAFAQAPAAGNPTIAEFKTNYTQVKNNLIRMAEKMPADSYEYKPVAEVRTFAALMVHIADAQMRTCTAINSGQAKSTDAGTKTAKDDVVAALKASFAECDTAWDATNDANAFQMIAGGRGSRSRLGSIAYMTVVHNSEEYGYGAMYLRSKGLVPPSSDTAGRGGR
jgi:uncharacterized damage-inducible protein DinB